MNNIFLGKDANGRFQLNQLRALSKSEDITPGARPVRDIHFDYDGNATLKAHYEAREDNLLAIKSVAQGVAPAFFALHIELGTMELYENDVIGVLVKSKSTSSVTARVALRSATTDGFVDSFMPKTIISFAKPSVHLDAVAVASLGNVPVNSELRELIFFFESGDLDIDLLDMRIFIT